MNILYFSILCLSVITASSHNAKADDYQSPISRRYYEQLCMPIQDFTAKGINSFLTSTYNATAYTEVLPNNFSHLIQFLEHGDKTKNSRSYAQAVFRLFTNKAKACSYINAESYCFLLEQLLTLLKPYMTVHKTDRREYMHQQLNSLLYTTIAEKSPFKQDPAAFLDNLSLELLEILYAEHTNDLETEALRKTILIFLEVGLNKLVWSPVDDVNTWQCVKRIAEHLSTLTDNGILIDTDDLNGLYITLTERYCLFLDLVSTDLPLKFYKTINADINTSTISFLTLAEEPNIESKKERLQRALSHCYEKAQAYQYMQNQQRMPVART